MISSAPARAAWVTASARTIRPSASVLPISKVVPFSARTTSLGRVAVPLGIFSAAARMPITRTGRRSAATAHSAPRTAAPPPRSVFIVYMLSGPFRSRPPESKVIVLPTSATVRVAPPSGS